MVHISGQGAISLMLLDGACWSSLTNRCLDQTIPHSTAIDPASTVATQLLGLGEPLPFAAECAQCLANVEAALVASSSGPSHVLKTVCLLTDMEDYSAFNEEYVRLFADPSTRPARVCYAVKGLPMGARVEIECIAVLGPPMMRPPLRAAQATREASRQTPGAQSRRDVFSAES